MAYKTRFLPKNIAKYGPGDPMNIVCRSLWERKFAKYCDETAGILRWSSEEIVIPYVSPLDGQTHRYFPDFLIEVQSQTGVRHFLIEIKPRAQTQPPKPRKRKRKFLEESATFAKNQAKWAAAQDYCRKRGWHFLVLTESDLYGKGSRFAS